MKKSTIFLIIVCVAIVGILIILGVANSMSKQDEESEEMSQYEVTESTEVVMEEMPTYTLEEIEEYNSTLYEARSHLKERFDLSVSLSSVKAADVMDPSMEQCVEYGAMSDNEIEIRKIVAYLASKFGGEPEEYGCEELTIDEETMLTIFHLYGPNGMYEVILDRDAETFYVKKTSNTGKQMVKEEPHEVEMSSEMEEQYEEIRRRYNIPENADIHIYEE